MADRRRASARLLLALVVVSNAARAEDATPGYPERVLHWTTKSSETCEDIAASLYGSAKHNALLERYNSVRCGAGKPLPDGLTLVVPAKVIDLPSARLRSIYPDVKARPPGGGWQPAAPGMPLYKNHSVNTLDKARADILFIDRTRVLLAEHTLVIIYGTASKTAVAKTPPAVELDSGELQAGLAALRGKPVEVATQGGRVSAQSRDTSVRAKDKRATVSVFDGKANVASAKKNVEIPTNYGSSFERGKAPAPPRPLPPAPKWLASTFSGTVLSAPGKSVVSAAWEAVDKARSYRVELAKDASFAELIAREEVPGDVRAFRAERLPPGAYYMRVRAIDIEDFLGIAAETKILALAEVEIQSSAGSIGPGVIDASPYDELTLGGFDGLELSLDNAAFGKVPPRVDLLRLAPKAISLRVRGSTSATAYEIRYREPVVRAHAVLENQTLRVRAELSAVEGVDIPGRMAPFARFVSDGQWRREPLRAEGGAWVASFGGVRAPSPTVHIVDARGRVLAEATPKAEPTPPDVRPRKNPRFLGASAALVQPSPVSNVVWWAPQPEDAASVSATGYSEGERLGTQMATRASGAVGSFGFDGMVTTRELDGAPADGSAWFMLRWRPVDAGGVQLGPALQLALPMTATSPASRIGLGLGAGGFSGRFHWLANLGGRAPVEYSADRRAAPDAQGYLLGGVGYDPNAWLRGYALLDAHALSDSDDELSGRGGFTLGAELGGSLFGGLSLRVSPWSDAGGRIMGQLALGMRARP